MQMTSDTDTDEETWHIVRSKAEEAGVTWGDVLQVLRLAKRCLRELEEANKIRVATYDEMSARDKLAFHDPHADCEFFHALVSTYEKILAQKSWP